MGKEINKKMHTEILPLWENGHQRGRINWEECVNLNVEFIYGDIKGTVIITSYNKEKQMIDVMYNNKTITTKTSDFKKGKIGRLLGVRTADFKVEIGTCYKDDKRDITIIDREYRKYKKQYQKWYKYHCNIDGYEDWIEENHLIKRNNGCTCCSSHHTVLGINSIADTDPWMIPYIGEECAKTHTHNSNEYCNPICIDCGRIKDKPMMISTIYRYHSIGCSCGDGYSYGHKYTYNLLTQLQQNFIDNYTFKWCRFYNPFKQKNTDGEYDFVLENIKIIIEVDGDFHRKDNDMSGQTKEESEWLDKIKEKLANDNKYKVIRISDEGDIKQNILNSDLNYLFDLSNIDWGCCDKFALSNRVKEACELKKNNPNYTTGDIGKIMGYHYGTIRRWLVKGCALNWCHYDGKEEQIKNGLRKQNKL